MYALKFNYYLLNMSAGKINYPLQDLDCAFRVGRRESELALKKLL